MTGRLNGLDLFSGIGGISVALAPWVRTVAYCDSDQHSQAILLSRMAAGDIEPAPIWDDVRTLRTEHIDGQIDIVVGGFPCTDLSQASRGRGKGLSGEESGLWYEMLRIIRDLRPGNVFIENVAGAARDKWLPFVRRDLWRLGYSSMSIELQADYVGAPFKGSRIFVAASDCNSKSAISLNAKTSVVSKSPGSRRRGWGTPEASALGMDDGIPHGLDRLCRLGNAVVPDQAREAFCRLMGIKEAL